MDYLIPAKSFQKRINWYAVSEWNSEICEGLFSDRLEVARNCAEKNNYVKKLLDGELGIFIPACRHLRGVGDDIYCRRRGAYGWKGLAL